MNFEELRYEVRDRVATITFDRPRQRNAWTAAMERELRGAASLAAADRKVRAIVHFLQKRAPDFPGS